MGKIDDPNYMFGWQTYPDGRVRFCGLVRGVDEAGHNSLAVDLNGTVSYGEVALESVADAQRYRLVVSSMGWHDELMLGAPLDASVMRHFSPSQAVRVQRLILQLVSDFVRRNQDPGFLTRPQTAFTGDVRFTDNWCFVVDERAS